MRMGDIHVPGVFFAFVLLLCSVLLGTSINFQHQTTGIPILIGIPPNAQIVGNATSLTLEPGAGLGWTCTPGPAMVCTASLGVSVATKTTIQTGACDFVDSQDGLSAYTYSFGSAPGCQALASYQAGAHYLLRVKTTNSGACSLNIDTLGAVTIKDSTGLNDPPANSIVPGRFYWIVYDGTVFRLI